MTETKRLPALPETSYVSGYGQAAVPLQPGERRTVTVYVSGYQDTPGQRAKAYGSFARKLGPDVQVEQVHAADDFVEFTLIGGTPARVNPAKRRLAPGTRPEQALQAMRFPPVPLDGSAPQPPRELLVWKPDEGWCAGSTLTPCDAYFRDVLRAHLGLKPWELGETRFLWHVPDGAEVGELAEVQISHAPVVGKTREACDEKWNQVAREVIGHTGWSASYDPIRAEVVLRTGTPLNIPDLAEPMWSLLDSLPPETFAFGTDGYGNPLTIDLNKNGGTLIAGKQGSGKSVALQILIYNAITHGLDIAVVDPVKGGPDFAFARKYDAFGLDGCETYEDALRVVDAVYDEGLRRKALHKKYGVGKWSELPAEVREAEGIRPLLLVVDEATSLVAKDFVPTSLARDDERRVQIETLNGIRQLIVGGLAKIARELRAVGIRPVLGTQRYEAGEFGGGGLRANLGNRVLMGRADSVSIGMTFQDAPDAEEAYAQAHGEKAVQGESGSTTVGKVGRAIAEIDGKGHVPFQGWYASQDALAEQLAEREIEPRKPVWVSGAAESDAEDEVVDVAPVEVSDDFWAADEDDAPPVETTPRSLPKPEPTPVPAATDDEGEWEE